MPQGFVKYSPDVEQPEPNFDEFLEPVIEATKAYIERSVESEGVGRATREAHAKGFDDGATFTIPARPVRRRLRGLERFTVTRGGEYAFVPSLTALRWLADLEP